MISAAAGQGFVNQMQNIAALNTGNCLPYSGVSGTSVVSSYSCNGDRKLFHRTKILLKGCNSKRSFACTASGGQRKNPDFSRQSKGFSRGRNRQNQERENSWNSEDATDVLSSKNGPLLSLSSNPRHLATGTPGPKEREIVEIFRKVQVQLRERAAVKDEKKAEASSRGQGEKRGSVDSLLKLLREHSVDQGKTKSGAKNFDLDRPERSSPFEDGQNSSFLESSSVVSEEDVEETSIIAVTRRPPSKFQRRSPVPRVEYQPVYSEEGNASLGSPLKSGGEEENAALVEDEEPISLDVLEAFDDEPSESFEIDDTDVDITGLSSTENADLSSLKISELRALAKSRGLKRYSKLKKGELVELLSSEGD